MEKNFFLYLMYFFIYAFIGWVVEVSFHAVTVGKFINRGFLSGPYHLWLWRHISNIFSHRHSRKKQICLIFRLNCHCNGNRICGRLSFGEDIPRKMVGLHWQKTKYWRLHMYGIFSNMGLVLLFIIWSSSPCNKKSSGPNTTKGLKVFGYWTCNNYDHWPTCYN